MTTMNGHANGTTAPFEVHHAPTWTWPRQDDTGQSRTPADSPVRGKTTPAKPGRRYPWPLLVIAAPAAVAVWSGWVGLGAMCGFGVVDLLPGIANLRVNTAITLPVGIESYGAYALASWISGKGSARTRTFAFRSAIGALALGCLGQVAFHLLAAAGWTVAPWPVVMAVACLPVVTLSFAAALVHLKRADATADTSADSGGQDKTADMDSGQDKTGDVARSGQPGKNGGDGTGLAGSTCVQVAAVTAPRDDTGDKPPDTLSVEEEAARDHVSVDAVRKRRKRAAERARKTADDRSTT